MSGIFTFFVLLGFVFVGVLSEEEAEVCCTAAEVEADAQAPDGIMNNPQYAKLMGEFANLSLIKHFSPFAFIDWLKL